MRVIPRKSLNITLCALLALPAASLSAQAQDAPQAQSAPQTQNSSGSDVTIAVNKDAPGPDVKGFIASRSADKLEIQTADGQRTTVAVNDATRIKVSAGLFASAAKLNTDALVNGIPVTIKTAQSGSDLVATQINLRNKDYQAAAMIRNATDQRFASNEGRLSAHDQQIQQNAAATEALRGRLGDIDNYNIKGTTNVNFDTGKANLSEEAKTELCQAAQTAESTNNALLLVVGYTDSTGTEEINQALSEKRAAKVVNYLQQACHWKPYRMLTPTGMATADPAADNSTPEGKAQNRRVAVNVLVSKSVDVASSN